MAVVWFDNLFRQQSDKEDFGSYNSYTFSSTVKSKKNKRPEWLSIFIWEFKNRKWKDNRQKRKARYRFKDGL